MSERLLSVQETAEILSINYQLCRGLIKAGQIKSTMVGKRHKVKPEWIDQYLKRNSYEPEKVYYDRKPGRKPKVMYR